MGLLWMSLVLPFLWSSVTTLGAPLEPTYGLELTFTNGYLIRKGKKEGINNDGCPASRRARDQWARRMKDICQERWGHESCTVESGERRGYKYHRVTYRDGWYYNITVDPLVIEVTAKPMTLREVKGLRHRIENDIFRLAAQDMSVGGFLKKAHGLNPSRSVGGGHIHIGFQSAFAKHANPALFVRNFLVDFSNHPTLAFLSLNRTKNDPSISLLKPSQRRAFRRVLQWYDREQPSVRGFVKEVQSRVYYDTYRQPTEKDPESWFPPQKYQAINLTRLANDEYPDREKTIEIRSLRPQKNTKDLLRVLELIERRLKHVYAFQGTIPYEPQDDNLHVLPKRTLKDRAQRELKSYVETVGLSFQDYKDFLD